MTFVLVTLQSLRGGGIAVALFLCLLPACSHKPASWPVLAQPSPLPPQILARDAQRQLLQEAHRALKEERYSAAALFFKRFTEVARDSPYLAEAYWWLGRCYEHLGDFPGAMAQYRLLSAGSLLRQTDAVHYESQALRRLDELYNLRVSPHSLPVARLVLRLRVDQLPPISHLSTWLDDAVQGGIMAIAVVPSIPGREGLGLELMREVSIEAHRLGLLFWVALDPHRGDGLDIRPEWKASALNGARHAGVLPLMTDIAHPAYQSYLEGVMSLLGQAGGDGLLLLARSAPGFADEFSSESLREFTASLGRDVSPEKLWGIDPVFRAQASERPVEYWRWVGWKARSYGQLVKRLRRALRDQQPTATLAVEVHQSSLTAPLVGLQEFGEDVAELSMLTGGSVVVRREEAAGVSSVGWRGVGLKTGDANFSIIDLDEYVQWNRLMEMPSSPAAP